jgi:hypothetical protein
LMVCVEAGMSLDAALTRVAEEPEGRTSPLHQEMMRTQPRYGPDVPGPRPFELSAIGPACRM